MVSIKWCLENKQGLSLINPNKNMSASYIGMAEESIDALQEISRSNIWTATISYYIFYYSLYSLMLRVGVKCEIHSCSLEFMKEFLTEFYDETDMKMISRAFRTRINLQYYAGRSIDENAIEDVKKYCKIFFVKTKDILSKISERQIEKIRAKLEADM